MATSGGPRSSEPPIRRRKGLRVCPVIQPVRWNRSAAAQAAAKGTRASDGAIVVMTPRETGEERRAPGRPKPTRKRPAEKSSRRKGPAWRGTRPALSGRPPRVEGRKPRSGPGGGGGQPPGGSRAGEGGEA